MSDRGMREERRKRKRRRPSGEPPPLPREPDWTRWLWLCALIILIGIALSAWLARSAPVARGDSRVLSAMQDLRGPFLNRLAELLWGLTLPAVVFGLRTLTVVALVVTKRFRHLAVFLGTFIVTDWVATRLLGVSLPVSAVPPITSHPDFDYPSAAVASLSVTLFSMAFVLIPGGKPRSRARGIATVLMMLVVLAGCLLAAGFPISLTYSAVYGAVIPFVLFKWLAPEESFPVSYRRGGNAAHLDLTGARGDAVRSAVGDQLGLDVVAVEAFGLEGSGGSSPLRMTLADGSHRFGKIYATSHVRADRWYKIGRTILYGQLEDEVPFGSVLRLVEYEDYALRLMRDVGIGVATTYGVVELTPEREYLLVTQMFENAQDVGHASVDRTVIDEGLDAVRRLWDAGIAHRDIKPANLLVVDGHLQIVDVSSIELRPTPWREAVDLANMMLTLALRSDPDTVYERALRSFRPEEIAEAFASAVGLAVPTQLQTLLKEDPRPLARRFRELAPPHEPISIQRWSPKRIAITGAAALAVLVLAGLFVDALRAGLA